jgi:hypothetical protein
MLTKFLWKSEIDILETSIRSKIFYQLEFMGKLINLEETSMDRVDNIIIKNSGSVTDPLNIAEYLFRC